MAISFKEETVFSEANRDRLRKIIRAGTNIEEIAKIPPIFIVADLTWRCNYSCLGCVDKEAVNQNQKDLPVEIIEDIFDYSKNHRVRGIMTMGGEVFLYKEGIKKALEKSVEHRIPLKTVTNGSCLRPYISEIVKAYSLPGSHLRVSVNSNRENYQRQTRGNASLDDVFRNIKEITSRNTPVAISTVAFPESSREEGVNPNIQVLEQIAEQCMPTGVNPHILLPARDPVTKARYKLSDEEKEKLRELKEKYPHLEMSDLIGNGERIRNQKLDFYLCPSGFLFTLIGSNGNIYKCTDNRGREDMVLGQIKKPGDFQRFWHSTERVEKQLATQCPNQGCVRYKINSELETARNCFKDRGPDMTDLLTQEKSSEYVFV